MERRISFEYDDSTLSGLHEYLRSCIEYYWICVVVAFVCLIVYITYRIVDNYTDDRRDMPLIIDLDDLEVGAGAKKTELCENGEVVTHGRPRLQDEKAHADTPQVNAHTSAHVDTPQVNAHTSASGHGSRDGSHEQNTKEKDNKKTKKSCEVPTTQDMPDTSGLPTSARGEPVGLPTSAPSEPAGLPTSAPSEPATTQCALINGCEDDLMFSDIPVDEEMVEYTKRRIELALHQYRQGHAIHSLKIFLRGMKEINYQQPAWDMFDRAIVGCINGIGAWIRSPKISDSAITELQQIYRSLKDLEDSDVTGKYLTAFRIRIPLAFSFRSKGVRGFDNTTIKTLYFIRAKKMMEDESLRAFKGMILPSIEEDIETALAFCHGKDYQVLKYAAQIKSDVGKMREAFEYCEQALKIRPHDDDMKFLHLELLIEVEDLSETTSVAESEYAESEDGIDYDFLEGTNAGGHIGKILKQHGNKITLVSRCSMRALQIVEPRPTAFELDARSDKSDNRNAEWEVEPEGKQVRLHIGPLYLAVRRGKKKACLCVVPCEGAKPPETRFTYTAVGDCVKLRSDGRHSVYICADEDGNVGVETQASKEGQLFQLKMRNAQVVNKKKNKTNKKGVKKRLQYKMVEAKKHDTGQVTNGFASEAPNHPEGREGSNLPGFHPISFVRPRPESKQGNESKTNSLGNNAGRRHEHHSSTRPPRRSGLQPKLPSTRVYSKLIEQYEINIACTSCCVEENSYVRQAERKHDCGRDKILLRSLDDKDGWVNARKLPYNYKRSDNICDAMESTQDCPDGTKCRFAHSRHELNFWNLVKEYNWGFEPFLADLTSSTLIIRHVLLNAFEYISALEVCNECFTQKKYDKMTKENRNTPSCKNAHPWINTNVVLKLKGDEHAYCALDDSAPGDVDNPHAKASLNELRSLLKKGFTKLDILQESRKVSQMTNPKNKQKQSKYYTQAPRFHTSSTSSRASGSAADQQVQWPDHEDYYDVDLSSLPPTVDIDVPYVADDMPCEDESGSSSEDSDDEGDNSKIYYNLFSLAKCRTKMGEKPEKYKECSICLSGSQRAVCSPFDRTADIEIRGRHNCGPTFDGDIVIVEIMNVDKLDSSETTRRGRVICLVHESVARESYVFVCTVDTYLSHLMRPICGTAPKIHVEHSLLDDMPHAVRNSRVCVYEDGGGGYLEHVRTVGLEQRQEHNQLFVVRYQKWDPAKMYPKGYVSKVIRTGTELVSGQKVLSLICQVPPPLTDINTDTLPDEIPIHLLYNRTDLRGLHVISIDPPGCEDIDDALSVQEVAIPGDGGEAAGRDKIYEVGIHIADVSAFVSRGDELDTEAQKRRTTFYPISGEPIHMFPKKLSTKLCSLRENEDHLCLSLVLKIDQNGHVQKDSVQFLRTIIRNKKQMTYEGVQSIIEESSCSGTEEESNIKILHALSLALRRNRLAQGIFKRECVTLSDRESPAFEAHKLIEEFMILANTFAARFLHLKFPEHGIFRSQQEPQREKLDEFVNQQKEMVTSSSFFPSFSDILHLVGDRVDLEELDVFSVHSCGWSYALSIQKTIHKERVRKKKKAGGDKENDETSREITIFEVGIHVTDITTITERDTEVDRVAYRRRAALFPQEGEPITAEMRNTCSFAENEARPCLSIMVRFKKDEEGTEVQDANPRFLRTVIKNNKKLTIQEIERIIQRNPRDTTELEKNVRVLHSLAKVLYQRRMDKKHKGESGGSLLLDAAILATEFRILANDVAENSVREKDEMLGRYIGDHLKWDKDGMSDSWPCCLRIFREQLFLPLNNSVTLLDSVFDELRKASNSGNMSGVKKLVSSEELHPSLAILFNSWYEIQNPAEVALCSGEAPPRHFTLHKDYYTWFTSPIRRYVDVIVHRFIVAAITSEANRVQPPYTKQELATFCKKFNRTNKRQKEFSRRGLRLKAAVAVKETPVFMPAVIASCNDDGLELLLPFMPRLPKQTRTVPFRSLNVHGKPLIEERTGKTIACWSRRLYDTKPNEECKRTKVMCVSNFSFLLNSQAHCVSVPKQHWIRLMNAVSQDNEVATERELERLMDEEPRIKAAGSYHVDATSEMKYGEALIRHHANFQMGFENAQVAQVQMGVMYRQGLIEPKINVFGLTNTLDLCIEHVGDPVTCFSKVATLGHRKEYISLQQYKETWLPMLAMEAACVSSQDGDAVVINNVPVLLQRRNDVLHGSLRLSNGFCKSRYIHFISNTKEEEEESVDYLCLKFQVQRSSAMLAENTVISPQALKEVVPHIRWKNLWIAHAVGKKAQLTRDKDIKFDFVVNHSNTEPPMPIQRAIREGEKVLCSIEFITKALPHKRMEKAVDNVEEVDSFCRNIVLGKLFTPEGTGKTLTAVKIAYWFSEVNKQAQTGATRRQVMYCGPSNSAVDVAIKLMVSKLERKCPKVLRIYGETLENQVFAIPRDISSGSASSRGRQYRLTGKKEESAYGLHHLIRDKSNSFSSKIKLFDRLFKNVAPEDVSEEQIDGYKKLITDAAVEEVKKYDVIFCTCSVSPSPRIIRAANIYQLIIDECGMCMEPESLIPMIALKPVQVVLIGDHKQLRPIVVNQIAKDLGLEVSLFERHADIMGDAAIMLDDQYRMHPAICDFPSKHFYEHKLKTNISMEWTWDKMRNPIWPNRQYPIVFCHVEGAEKTLPVATEKGNENSKSNELERDEVVEIFMELVNNHNIEPDEITVLSQYKAQCNEIMGQLKEYGFENATVSTVVASQGDEQDYIILSTVRSLAKYEIEKLPSEGWMKKNLGFITDEHQINVALTRARKGIIIVGNKHLLRCHPMWRDLLWYYKKNHAVVDRGTFPYRSGSPWQPFDEERNRRGLKAHLREMGLGPYARPR